MLERLLSMAVSKSTRKTAEGLNEKLQERFGALGNMNISNTSANRQATPSNVLRDTIITKFDKAWTCQICLMSFNAIVQFCRISINILHSSLYKLETNGNNAIWIIDVNISYYCFTISSLFRNSVTYVSIWVKFLLENYLYN